jgi:hypothetical protein
MEPSGSVQACNGIALLLSYIKVWYSVLYYISIDSLVGGECVCWFALCNYSTSTMRGTNNINNETYNYMILYCGGIYIY